MTGRTWMPAVVFVVFLLLPGCGSNEIDWGDVPPLTDDTFDEATAEGVVLVDVWASWCAPCHQQAPIVKEIAAEYEGDVAVYQMDAEANPRTVQRFAVRGIPRLLLLRDGEPVTRPLEGVHSKDQIAALLDDALEQ